MKTTRLAIVLLVVLLCSGAEALCAGDVCPGDGYEFLGTIQSRHARDIESSNWSIGAETMDRDYTVYKHWRAYLGPLGVKRARIQSGWAKTEKSRGEYDWEWTDEIIPDMAAQGVEPWVCLCYGNSIYPDGGGAGLGGKLPASEEALEAWEQYVAAFVERYRKYVDEYEIWNEPNLRRKDVAGQYARFLIRTAQVIRARQPDATIIGISCPGVNSTFTDRVLSYLEQQDKLNLLDEVTYHPYRFNPDAVYDEVARLRKTIRKYSDRIAIRQGENGAPSQRGSFGALSNHDWTERRQAKWALRRLLGDLGRDITSSYFAICDMHYPSRKNYKGLLATNPDQTVHHAKLGYRAVQHVTAVFDDTVDRIEDYPPEVSGTSDSLSVFGYRAETGGQIVTLWRDSAGPGQNSQVDRITLTLPEGDFTDPVWVDMLSGEVYAIDEELWDEQNGSFSFRSVPVYDSVILIADREAIALRSTPNHN